MNKVTLWDGSHPLAGDADTAALGEAVERNIAARARFFAMAPGCQAQETPQTLRVIDAFNYRVALARLSPDAVEACIANILDDARRRYITWVVGPTTRPPDLADRLKRQGFSPTMEEPGMALKLVDLSPPPAVPGLHIVRVDMHHLEAIDRFNRIAEASFRRPIALGRKVRRLVEAIGPDHPHLDHMRFYLGYLDRQPVASASALVGAGVVGIYTVGTVPAARGQGIASQMTFHALARAYTEGLRIGILHASEQGQGLYRRLGFRPVCQMIWLATVARPVRKRRRLFG